MEAKLTIDLGNSETRIMVSFTNENSIEQNILSKLPNGFGEIYSQKNYFLNTNDYTFDVSYVYKAGKKLVCAGVIAESQFGNAVAKPTATTKKYKAKFIDYSLPLIIYRAYEILDKFIDVGNESIELNINFCLPAQDIDVGYDNIKAKLDGLNTVSLIRPDFSATPVIKELTIVPEGFASYVALGNYEPTILNGMTLVIDVGDGTTDFCILNENNLMRPTLHSLAIGGNKVIQKTKLDLEKTSGTNAFSDKFVRELVQGGYPELLRKHDIKVEDVEEIITNNIEEVGGQLVNEINKYLLTLNIEPHEINHIILTGGGSLAGYYRTENSINSVLNDYFTEVFEEGVIVELPHATFIEYDPIEGFVENTGTLSPRLLNIIGASLV